MFGNQGDRTEKPTPRRLREARRKGQVARSRDLGQAVSLAFAVAALGWFGSSMVGGLGRAVAEGLTGMSRVAHRDLTSGDLLALVLGGLRTLGLIVGPVAGAAAAAVIATHTLQDGFVVASEALQMNWGRMNPARNLKRLGFSMGGLDAAKLLVSVTALTFISVKVTLQSVSTSAQLARLAPGQAAGAGWAQVTHLLWQATLVLLAVAGADYALQRWRWLSSLRMTKQEVRDDFRLTEGHPEVKARVRRIQMAMVRRRMFAAVPRATVVVTNPTEYAVALEYRRGEMAAPRVVAKGRGFLASRIKEIARRHGVPLVENVPLAQALYKTVEVGDTIPAVLFEAVAEVLAYLIRLKQLVL